LNWPDSVADDTRARIALAIADLRYVRGAASGPLAAHWRRNNIADRLFQPAVTGRYPVRGRHPNMDVPIAEGLTPHGLRHTYKTLMEELGTSHKFMDAQMWRTALDARLAFAPGSPVGVLDRLLAARRAETGR
jgi:integrase